MHDILDGNPHGPQRIQVVLGLALALFGIFLGTDTGTLPQNNTTPSYEERVNPYEELLIEARSAIVWDVNNNQLFYGKNETSQLALASLAKLLTAVVALEYLDEEQTITITHKAIAAEGDSGFLVGEKWSLRELIELTLISSSNDGAAALAEAVSGLGREDDITTQNLFSHKVLGAIQRADMEQTYLLDPSGLDISPELSGAYGSAKDVAKLLSYILKHYPEILESTTYKEKEIVSLSQRIYNATNTNDLVERLPGIIGSKTGFTDLAGGNLAVVFDAGPARPVVAVVLGSSRGGRFSDVGKLVWATFQYLEYKSK